MELPGVDRQHVDLQVQPDRVVLTAERHERRRLGLLRHRTRTTGLLALALGLPAPVDPDGVTAELERGVLSVVLPKADAARRRRVPVRHRGS